MGVTLPNYGAKADSGAIRAIAQAAEDLRLDSVWATEHIIVGREAGELYGQVLDPLCTLAWVAGYTQSVALGTSIILLPLHHPIRLAKEAVTLQNLSVNRFRLGIGVGWHEPEFRFMGVNFTDRGARADESIQLMRALWRGDDHFSGTYWSFQEAIFAPLPSSPPEIWVGGNSARAIRRACDLGDVWHAPTHASVDFVADVKEQHPQLRVFPRIDAGPVDKTQTRIANFARVGCEGVVVGLDDDPDKAIHSMEELVEVGA